MKGRGLYCTLCEVDMGIHPLAYFHGMRVGEGPLGKGKGGHGIHGSGEERLYAKSGWMNDTSVTSRKDRENMVVSLRKNIFSISTH